MKRAGSLTLGILAGEPSGDNLGAGVMRAMRRAGIDVDFVGVGGPNMLEAGLQSLAPMEQLAVNGFREPLLRLPRLLGLLRNLIRAFADRPVDGFLGVDFNVFNFLLEKALKKRGLRTAHYVSPSVYAWRTGRVHRVAECADLLLCLYPFEPAYYSGTGVDAQYVGHPLADTIDFAAGALGHRNNARAALGIAEDALVLAVLPGSRGGELRLMLEDFLDAAQIFARRHSDVVAVIPCVREDLQESIAQGVAARPGLQALIDPADARRALTACDVALIKSGTSTLEAMLLHRPMVVSYRLGALSYQFARRVLRTPYIALPNILAGEPLVPELLQYQATPGALADALTQQLHGARAEKGVLARFDEFHAQLRQDADAKAAAAVLRLLGQ